MSRIIKCLFSQFKRYRLLTHSVNQSRQLSSVAEILATRHSEPILDSHISYLDTKEGKDAAIFIHGNPTQAYIWRNVIPYVEPVAQCLAPDLIGMGMSGKIISQYRFRDHFRYIDAWISSLRLRGKIHFILQDWGTALGFHWARQNTELVKSITFMEGIVRPMKWDDFSKAFEGVFKDLRSPKGEEMILDNNFFVESILPAGVLRNLTPAEKEVYTMPFIQPGESRRPTLTFPREIPIIEEDKPHDVVLLVQEYNAWLRQTQIPKLYLHAEPGFFSKLMQEEVASFPNTKVVPIRGHHFLQEDSPDFIGRAVRDFISSM